MHRRIVCFDSRSGFGCGTRDRPIQPPSGNHDVFRDVCLSSVLGPRVVDTSAGATWTRGAKASAELGGACARASWRCGIRPDQNADAPRHGHTTGLRQPARSRLVRRGKSRRHHDEVVRLAYRAKQAAASGVDQAHAESWGQGHGRWQPTEERQPCATDSAPCGS